MVEAFDYDHALEQTRLAGCTYAAVPLPWLIEWAENAVDRRGSRFQWWVVCMAAGKQLWLNDEDRADEAAPVDANGNVILCLMEPGHLGSCASARVMSMNTVMV